MAVVAITAANLTFETASAGLGVFGAASNTAGDSATTGGSAVATTASDGWLISAPTGRSLADGTLVLIFSAANTGDTFTITAGNRPPSQRADLAATTVTVTANKTFIYCPDVAAHLKTAGTIQVTATRTDSNLAAVLIPRGA